MARPNRAFANMAKRPFDHVSQHRHLGQAQEAAEALKAAGWDVKVTSLRLGPRGARGWYVHNVWKRERKDNNP